MINQAHSLATEPDQYSIVVMLLHFAFPNLCRYPSINMDKLLSQFIAVAEAKQISQAANVLCVAQPTLTHNMKRLEQKMGVSLFVRVPRGVMLTESGEYLYGQAKAMENIYSRTKEYLKTINEKDLNLRVGAGHVEMNLFLDNALRRFQETASPKRLHIEVANNLELMQLLLKGHIDMLVGHEVLYLSNRIPVQFYKLYESRDGYFVNEGHPLLGRVVSPEELKSYPLLLVTPLQKYHLDILDIDDADIREPEKVYYNDTAQPVIGSNSIEVGISQLKCSKAVLRFPMDYSSVLEQQGIMPLQVNEVSPSYKVGIYTLLNGGTPEGAKLLTQLIEQELYQIKR